MHLSYNFVNTGTTDPSSVIFQLWPPIHPSRTGWRWSGNGTLPYLSLKFVIVSQPASHLHLECQLLISMYMTINTDFLISSFPHALLERSWFLATHRCGGHCNWRRRFRVRCIARTTLSVGMDRVGAWAWALQVEHYCLSMSMSVACRVQRMEPWITYMMISINSIERRSKGW